MMERRHEGAEYPAHITFSKFKYKLQNLITEVRQLREKEQNTRRDLEILVQKQRNDEAEQHKKCAALHAEIAAAGKVRSNLENKVKDLQNEISIMANKQKESKGVIDSLLQSNDKLTNDLKESNYELKRDIDTKESMLAFLKGKLSRNLALLEAVEREVICVKLAIDETCQMLRGKEDEVFGLKQKLDKVMEYEKLFIEKIQLLENHMKEKQIELSKKDTVIADLKDRLEYMINDRKLQLQIEELQKLVEVKEEAIQNLLLEKEALLSEVQSLELVLSKFQDLQMETSPKRLLESQEVEYTLQEQILRAEETLTQQNQEECMRAEKENHDSESERSELLAQIHDLTENNTQYCGRGSSPYVKQEVDNLNQYQRDSSSTTEMQMRRSEKVYLGTRKEKSQCGQTCTLSKESAELAASKNAPVLEASQVNVQSSPITEVTYGQTVRNHRNIEKSISCEDKASNIHSIFLKLDQSGFLLASSKTDLYPYALDHCASSHSLSSSSLSTNGSASALIGEVSSKTYVKEEREQLLDSSNQTATNITEENKKVIDAEYQNASENARSEDNVMNGSKQVMDSVDQAVFEYATNGANVTDENNRIIDSACWTPFQKVTFQTSIMEKREQALDLANHIASLDARNETNVIEANQQAVDSVDQNGSNMKILTEENKEIRDSVDQIGVHNVTNHSNLREENEQALDSVSLTAFCNESKHPRFMKHGIFPDNIQERVVTSLVCTHSTSLPGEVKIQCPTKMDNSSTAEKEFNCNFNDTETNIIEPSGYVHEDCDDNLSTSKVKCVKCEQRFSDTHLNLEGKGLDEVALTNFSYTCQNCKNEHGKKRRKLGFLTPELVPKRYC